MAAVKILAFSGSLRKESWNTKLAKLAAEGAKEAGAEVTIIELRELPMPIYNEDEEKAGGIPPNGKKFKELMKSHQGLLIACPEYNSSITAALKNALDWASRPESGEKPLAAFDGKVAGLLAASPGALGGLRGLVTVRSILGNIKTIVLPEQVAVMKAHEAFEGGTLKDAKQEAAVKALSARVVDVCKKLNVG